jgi:hypothetical protein
MLLGGHCSWANRESSTAKPMGVTTAGVLYLRERDNCEKPVDHLADLIRPFETTGRNSGRELTPNDTPASVMLNQHVYEA